MNFQNKNLTYLKFICKDNLLDISSNAEKKILNHIDKLDKIVLVVINIYIFSLSLLSRIIFFTSIENLTNKRIKFLIKILFVFNFLIKKIDQIFFTIASLHLYGNEKLEEITLTKRDNFNNDTNHSKFIIIGSGPSGAVTASELSKTYPGETLIIEKGNFFDIPKSKHPGEEFSKKWYRGGLNSTYFSEMIAYSSGSCFGGGSEINSGLFHKPDKDFLQNWREEYHTRDLDPVSIEIFSEKVMSYTNLNENNDDKFSNLFINGAQKSEQEYSELRKFYQKDSNKKNSMSKTLLSEFLDNNGKVELNTDARNIKYKDKKWIIETYKNGNLKYYSCDYLFICCGSMFTNNLLLKSNISKDKTKIIRKFTFHPMIKMIGSYSENIQDLNEDVISHQNMHFWPDFIIGNASSSIQFLLSSFQKDIRIRDYIKKNWKRMKVFHATFSLGSGKIINLPFIKDPIILYFFKKSEKNIIKNASMKLFNFIENTGAKNIIPVTTQNSKLIKTDQNKDKLSTIKDLNNFQISSVHILGGVTMGEKPECVADSYGKIRNYDGLYVNDSSLINTKLLKNPQGTIMMIAYRNINNFLNNI